MSDLKINCVIGVDPGANGGIAVYIPGYNVKTVRMPKDLADLHGLFKYFAENYRPCVFIEKVNVRVDDLREGKGKEAMAKLFRIQKMIANYEHLKAIIEASGIPFVMVHPQKWISYLGLRGETKMGETKRERKARYKAFAASKYPGVKVTLWNADALNIMHFGRAALVECPKWVKANLPKKEYTKLFG